MAASGSTFENASDSVAGLGQTTETQASGLLGIVDSGLAWLLGTAGRSVGNFFGFLGLVFLLGIISTIPVLQFAVLGFFVIACRQVLVSGKLRDGFIGLSKGKRIIGLFLGGYLVLLPLKWAVYSYRSSLLINGPGMEASFWLPFNSILLMLTSLHLFGAVLAGGRFFAFLWPLFLPFTIGRIVCNGILRLIGAKELFDRFVRRQFPKFTGQLDQTFPASPHPIAVLWNRIRTGEILSKPATEFWALLSESRLWELWKTGLVVFLASIVWFAGPVFWFSLAMGDRPVFWGGLFYFFGTVHLFLCLNYFPLACVCYAKTLNWKAFGFGWSSSKLYSASPIRFTATMLVVVLLTVPVAIFRIEMIPYGLWWILAIPTATFAWWVWILWGWSGYHGFADNDWNQGQNTPSKLQFRRSTSFLWRWAGKLLFLSLVFVQAILLVLSIYLAWEGNLTLFRLPLYDLPTPFFFVR